MGRIWRYRSDDTSAVLVIAVRDHLIVRGGAVSAKKVADPLGLYALIPKARINAGSFNADMRNANEIGA